MTNPPIDPLREGLVMSLEMRLGRRGNLLAPSADSYHQIILRRQARASLSSPASALLLRACVSARLV